MKEQKRVALWVTLGEMLLLERLIELVPVDGPTGNTKLSVSELMDVRSLKGKLPRVRYELFSTSGAATPTEKEKQNG